MAMASGVAPPPRQRRQDDGRVQVALVVGGEDDRPVEPVQVLESLDAQPHEQPPRAAGATSAGSPCARPVRGPGRGSTAGSRTASRPRPGGSALRRSRADAVANPCLFGLGSLMSGHGDRWPVTCDEVPEVAHRPRRRERAFIQRRLEALLERHEQLDALERAERRAPRLSCRRRRRTGPWRSGRRTWPSGVAARVGPRGRRLARLHPRPQRRGASASACPRCAAGPRPARPTAPRMRWWSPSCALASSTTAAMASRCLAGTSTACTRSARPSAPTHDGGIAHAGAGQQHALDVLGKDVQTLGRDDHLLLAAADVQRVPRSSSAADVAGVQPAVLERRVVSAGRAVVARA